MIRWSFVAPRLLFAGAILAVITLGVDPVLRWSLRARLAAMVGAPCSVGQVDTSLFKADARIDDVSIAHPRESSRNLFQFERANLDLEMSALFQKKFVIRSGSLEGIRFGTPRDAEQVPRFAAEIETKTSADDDGFEFGLAKIQEMIQRVTSDVENEFASIQLAQQLSRRWPEEWRQIEIRIESLEKRVSDVSQLAQAVKDDPMQGLTRWGEITAQIQGVNQDRVDIQGELQRLIAQVQSDRKAVDQARQQDSQKIREMLQFEAFRPEAVAAHILGSQWTRRLTTTFGWVEWARRHLPYQTEELQPSRGRGLNVLFRHRGELPSLLVRELQVHGHWNVGSKQVPFTGIMRNVTNVPREYGHPATFSARATGELPFRVDVVLDHTQNPPVDSIGWECPAMTLPQLTLGNRRDLVVHVESAPAQVSIRLEVAGQDLSGHAEVRQEQLVVGAEFGPSLADTRFADRIHDAFSRVDSLETTINFHGTLRSPGGTIRSTLPDDLAAAVNSALSAEIAGQREKLLAQLQRSVDMELNRVTSQVEERRNEVRAKLAKSGLDLDGLTKGLKQSPAFHRIFGRAAPQGETFWQ